jgi:hypothetical protein
MRIISSLLNPIFNVDDVYLRHINRQNIRILEIATGCRFNTYN